MSKKATTNLLKKQQVLIKTALETWFWIERVETKYHPIPERYDKQLLKKVEKIQKLVDELLPDCDIADGGLVMTVESNLFGLHQFGSRKWCRRDYFGYDATKAMIHNDILRPLDYDPLIEFPISYKKKVMDMVNE